LHKFATKKTPKNQQELLTRAINPKLNLLLGHRPGSTAPSPAKAAKSDPSGAGAGAMPELTMRQGAR
jgi:hypothetical protein